mmetsp:Transcript_25238/g.57278  ORF Transcript_25238/g.57278 Transcript_25238/m.57278 type:complete len:258 (+) Transcript_25238:291-1064(+)
MIRRRMRTRNTSPLRFQSRSNPRGHSTTRRRSRRSLRSRRVRTSKRSGTRSGCEGSKTGIGRSSRSAGPKKEIKRQRRRSLWRSQLAKSSRQKQRSSRRRLRWMPVMAKRLCSHKVGAVSGTPLHGAGPAGLGAVLPGERPSGAAAPSLRKRHPAEQRSRQALRKRSRWRLPRGRQRSTRTKTRSGIRNGCGGSRTNRGRSSSWGRSVRMRLRRRQQRVERPQQKSRRSRRPKGRATRMRSGTRSGYGGRRTSPGRS